MTKTATITSKRQLTIPVGIYKHFKFKKGEKVVVSTDGGIIRIEPATNLIKRLAGSVEIPKKYRGMEIEELIRRAKEDYFKEKGNK